MATEKVKCPMMNHCKACVSKEFYEWRCEREPYGKFYRFIIKLKYPYELCGTYQEYSKKTPKEWNKE